MIDVNLDFVGLCETMVESLVPDEPIIGLLFYPGRMMNRGSAL